ncbi:MAG: molybdenum cofactor guanylyltransferase [Lachnospiraceae bacterium]
MIPMEKEIAGYILAGGQNRRMGGVKKLFLSYQERSFYDWLREGLSSLDKIYVSVEDQTFYESVKDELIVDKYTDMGSAGGILSGLLACKEDALLVIPCDMIPLPANIAEYMLNIYAKQPHPLVIKASGKLVPFPGIYTKEMLPTLQQMIDTNQCRIMNLWEHMNIYYTILSLDDLSLSNINTVADYQALKEGLWK